MRELYSPERRTALVLTGTGADGAYHAGVVRALQESGVKIDLVCGRGVGVVGAVFAAVDGASRLWDSDGLWHRAEVSRLYAWRWPLRLLLMAGAAIVGLLASPLLFVALGLLVYLIGLILGMAGLQAGAAVLRWHSDVLAAAFAPEALPTWLPRTITLAVLGALVALTIGAIAHGWRTPLRRRSQGRRAWTLLGAPLDARGATRHFVNGLWDLLKGGANVTLPGADDLSRRYTEMLGDNLGQPGFRELLVAVHDVDARRDLVFGLLREPFRRALFPPPAAGAAAAPSARRAEALDLAGLARDHLIDVMRAALSVNGWTEPVLVRFAPDSYWRGETHRLTDRAASLARLLEEAAAAGAEQVIVVSAAPEPAGPHELAPARVDPMGRLSEHAAAGEAAALRDALEHLQHRFRAVYPIRPAHNPVGAFDLAGAFDERSDRRHSVAEQVHRGYEDAYRQFIEPIVAT